MAIKLKIPPPMREATGGVIDIIVTGADVKACLDDLVRQHATVGTKIYDAKGELRLNMNVTINDEDIRYLDETATAVKDGDVIELIPAVAGG
jgi:molybdopterin converting factor small subunit